MTNSEDLVQAIRRFAQDLSLLGITDQQIDLTVTKELFDRIQNDLITTRRYITADYDQERERKKLGLQPQVPVQIGINCPLGLRIVLRKKTGDREDL